MKRKSVYIVLIFLLLVLLAAIVRHYLEPPQVIVIPVHRGDLAETLSATGVVESVQSEIAPKTVARITQLLVDEGDAVKQGQLLARLDDSELRASFRQNEALLTVAQAEAARIEAALVQERSASPARIAAAEAAAEAAHARLRDLRAGARPEEIEAARQAVVAARADEELAAADAARIQELFTGGAASQAQLDAAQARLAAARATLSAAQEKLRLAEAGARAEQIKAAESELKAAQANLENARAAAGQIQALERHLLAARARIQQSEAALAGAAALLAEAEVAAPITGHIGRRFLDVGDLAGPVAPIFLVSSSDIWIAAEVDEEDLALVYSGQPVEISAEALAQSATGEVVEIGAVALPRGLQQVRAKIVRCKVRLTEPNPLLRPGMEVDVTGTATLARNTLLLPNEALQEIGAANYVWVVKEGRIHKQEVQTAASGYRETAVTAGLQEGDLVVIRGAAELHEGARVSPSQE